MTPARLDEIYSNAWEKAHHDFEEAENLIKEIFHEFEKSNTPITDISCWDIIQALSKAEAARLMLINLGELYMEIKGKGDRGEKSLVKLISQIQGKQLPEGSIIPSGYLAFGLISLRSVIRYLVCGVHKSDLKRNNPACLCKYIYFCDDCLTDCCNCGACCRS